MCILCDRCRSRVRCGSWIGLSNQRTSMDSMAVDARVFRSVLGLFNGKISKYIDERVKLPLISSQTQITRWKVLWESTTPLESEISFFVANTKVATLATPTIRSIKCNNRRFTVFFDRYFHIALPIVTKHEHGLPFPLRNLPIKFGTNPSTIF